MSGTVPTAPKSTARAVNSNEPTGTKPARTAVRVNNTPRPTTVSVPRPAPGLEAAVNNDSSSGSVRISSPRDITGTAQFSTRPTLLLDDPPPAPRQRRMGAGWVGVKGGQPQPRPNAPGTATADLGDNGEISVSWQDLSTNETGFIIEGQTLVGASWGPGGTYTAGPGREHVLINVATGVHRFRVIAVNGNVQSTPGGWSVSVTVEDPVQPSLVPEAPTNPSAEEGNNRVVSVRWTDNSATETGFEIERDPVFSGNPLRTVQANVVVFNETLGLGTFRYRVRSFNDAGRSAYTTWATVVIAEVQPLSPTSLVVTPMGNERDIRLEWNDNSDNEASFTIQRQTQVGSQWGNQVELTAPANAESLVDAAGAGTFRYRVASTNAAGTSPFTAWVTGTVSASSGWTEFTPSSDTRIVYVSSATGNDSNNGFSESAPKRTIAAGAAQLRHGYPDWLLLKRGDTWVNESFGHWKKGGRSATEPMVIGAYGPITQARPFVQTGTAGGFYRQGGGGSPSSVDHLAMVSIRLKSHNRTGSTGANGFSWLENGTNLLIEDCSFEEFKGGIVIQGGAGIVRNVRIRRSVIVDSYSTNSHAQGLYFSKCNGVIIEECVVDQNGWRPGVAEPTIFNHNLYLQPNCENVVVRRNLIARASSHGAQLRGGGDADENVFIRNPIALLLGTGGADGGGSDPTRPLECNGAYNVVLDGNNINQSNPRGTGIEVLFASSGDIHHNIIAHIGSAVSPRPIHLDGSQGDGNRNVSLHHNLIYNWGGSVIFRGDTTTLQDIQFQDNTVQSTENTSPLIEHVATSSIGEVRHARNRFFSVASNNQWMRIGGTSHSFNSWRSAVGDVGSTAERLSFPDADRSVATYAASVGLSGTLEAFLTRAREQRKGAWADQFTAAALASYIREGFGMSDP